MLTEAFRQKLTCSMAGLISAKIDGLDFVSSSCRESGGITFLFSVTTGDSSNGFRLDFESDDFEMPLNDFLAYFAERISGCYKHEVTSLAEKAIAAMYRGLS